MGFAALNPSYEPKSLEFVMAEVAKARPASTILLLRDSPGPDGEGEIEVFMMVRHYEIDFNSGALVFPGGAVDPGDHDLAGKPALHAGGKGWMPRRSASGSRRSARRLRKAA